MSLFSRLNFTLLIFLLIYSPCHAYKILAVKGEYTFEVYEPEDQIPSDVIEEALQMYTEAYLHPRLHDGISLDDLKIDQSRFSSYDEFMQDMFQRDFRSYEFSDQLKHHYYQIRYNSQIVGVSAVLHDTLPSFYYIDHIAIHKEFRQKGLAVNLIELIKTTLPRIRQITLDTRVFNMPAQALYQKTGFTKLAVHPNPKKQDTYFHYIFLKAN